VGVKEAESISQDSFSHMYLLFHLVSVSKALCPDLRWNSLMRS